MKLSLYIISIILATALLTACGHSNGSAEVPRPSAYPRIEFPDSSYTELEISGVSLLFNSGAETEVREVENGAWIDVIYPCFATPRLYLTLTVSTPQRIRQAVHNRQERINLNLGMEKAELTQLTSSGGWACDMIVSPVSMTTPVQILAHDATRVVSGALVVTLPDSVTPDPAVIAPIVKGVERDLLVLLKAL